MSVSGSIVHTLEEMGRPEVSHKHTIKLKSCPKVLRFEGQEMYLGTWGVILQEQTS